MAPIAPQTLGNHPLPQRLTRNGAAPASRSRVSVRNRDSAHARASGPNHEPHRANGGCRAVRAASHQAGHSVLAYAAQQPKYVTPTDPDQLIRIGDAEAT